MPRAAAPWPTPAATTPPLPLWLRRALAAAGRPAGADHDDIALAAGAAIATLDALVRREAEWAGVWRQRLALRAAAVTARHYRRPEDEAALRDAVLLTRPGDEVGPAGRMVLAWRRLATRPAGQLPTRADIAAMLEEFGLAPDAAGVAALSADLRRLAAGEGIAGLLTGVMASAGRCAPGPVPGVWLADLLLAQRLGWAHAVPLLGSAALADLRSGRASAPSPRRSAAAMAQMDGPEPPDGRLVLLAGLTRAAIHAVDLALDLERRAQRLLAVAPKLRARASDRVVDALLSSDALVASQPVAGITDRGLRRLFDRLIDLGAVRELTGRPTFRIYGL